MRHQPSGEQHQDRGVGEHGRAGEHRPHRSGRLPRDCLDHADLFAVCCPAVLTYLIGSMYSPKKIVDSIASMIVVSTIMSFITLPIVVFFALKYFY